MLALQKWHIETWSRLPLKFFTEQPYWEFQFASSVEMGYSPTDRSLKIPLSPDICPNDVPFRSAPCISITFLFAFNSPQLTLGSWRGFQHDCATGCQMETNLSFCKQTKQNSFQDVGLLCVWAGTWANTGMLQFLSSFWSHCWHRLP